MNKPQEQDRGKVEEGEDVSMMHMILSYTDLVSKGGVNGLSDDLRPKFISLKYISPFSSYFHPK